MKDKKEILELGSNFLLKLNEHEAMLLKEEIKLFKQLCIIVPVMF